jgi:hypothetical protein
VIVDVKEINRRVIEQFRAGGPVVIASNMAAPAHPDWFLNLTAHPAVTVEVGDERFGASAARTATP